MFDIFLYVLMIQIEDGDMSGGNATGAHDLQPAPPGQPLSQATGTDVVHTGVTDWMYSTHLSISH